MNGILDRATQLAGDGGGFNMIGTPAGRGGRNVGSRDGTSLVVRLVVGTMIASVLIVAHVATVAAAKTCNSDLSCGQSETGGAL